MIDHEIDAYKKLEALIIENEKTFSKNNEIPSLVSVRSYIEMLTVSKEFGIDLEYYGHRFYRVSKLSADNVFVKWYGEESEQSISWPDDGMQPADEWLMTVKFPAGPYILGDGYPKDSFNKFFCELKDFGPKYADTVNKGFCFSSERAADVVAALPSLFEKYKKMAQLEVARKEEGEIKKKLAKIQREIKES